MKLIIQRVLSARVSIPNQPDVSIKQGLLVLVGFTHTDQPVFIPAMAKKLVQLRIFSDENGKMNRSLLDVSGELLMVSQFTLYADTTKGNRPSFVEAARPIFAETLYNQFVKECARFGISVKTGQFGAYMQVNLINDGPVTILLEQL